MANADDDALDPRTLHFLASFSTVAFPHHPPRNGNSSARFLNEATSCDQVEDNFIQSLHPPPKSLNFPATPRRSWLENNEDDESASLHEFPAQDLSPSADSKLVHEMPDGEGLGITCLSVMPLPPSVLCEAYGAEGEHEGGSYFNTRGPNGGSNDYHTGSEGILCSQVDIRTTSAVPPMKGITHNKQLGFASKNDFAKAIPTFYNVPEQPQPLLKGNGDSKDIQGSDHQQREHAQSSGSVELMARRGSAEQGKRSKGDRHNAMAIFNEYPADVEEKPWWYKNEERRSSRASFSSEYCLTWPHASIRKLGTFLRILNCSNSGVSSDAKAPGLASSGLVNSGRVRARTGIDPSLGVSFAALLVPKRYNYDPYTLDNPRFNQSQHHTVMVMSSYSISVIPFVKPSRLKDEMNEAFHEANLWLHKSMTLSKLRNLKADLFGLLSSIPSMEISTVACAWVYFERLVMKGLVTKVNRKLFAAVCLILSYKFNQHLEAGEFYQLTTCIQCLDKKENLSNSEIFATEFQVFAMLDFTLSLDLKDVLPHILQDLNKRNLAYEDVYGAVEI